MEPLSADERVLSRNLSSRDFRMVRSSVTGWNLDASSRYACPDAMLPLTVQFLVAMLAYALKLYEKKRTLDIAKFTELKW